MADSLFCLRTKDAIEFRDGQLFGKKLRNLAYLPNKDTPFTGIAIAFHPNNRSFVQYEVYYRHGLMYGPWVKWYDKRGQQAMQGTHIFGRKDGLETSWHENGQKSYEANYKDGAIGRLITTWYENGQKQSERTYKDGRFISAEVWKPNGEKCPVTKIDEEGNGIVVWYKEDGTKRSWDTFRRGRNLIYQ